jgi:hypothetical protein
LPILPGGRGSGGERRRRGYVKDMTGSSKRDAIDQLEYEDLVLRRLLRAMGDENRDRPTHGRVVKLFVERMAVRQAARELVGDALVRVPQMSETASRLQASIPAEREALDHLDEMTRGIAPHNVNQSQDVDSAVSETAPSLLHEIDEDLSELIPSVHQRMDANLRKKVLPSASYVLRHCPLHPGAHERNWVDHIGPLVWLHAVYDYLRSVPVGGVKPKAQVTIPGEGLVPIDEPPPSI